MVIRLLAEVTLFLVGSRFAFWWFTVIILPLFYGFPRSAWWVANDWLRWQAPFNYLLIPMFWSVVLFVLTIVGVVWFPWITNGLRTSIGFQLGQLVGSVHAMRAAVRQSGRYPLHGDFLAFVRNQLTASGWAHLQRDEAARLAVADPTIGLGPNPELHRYFCYAVAAWLFERDRTAREAAVVASQVAEQAGRVAVIEWLRQIPQMLITQRNAESIRPAVFELQNLIRSLVATRRSQHASECRIPPQTGVGSIEAEILAHYPQLTVERLRAARGATMDRQEGR